MGCMIGRDEIDGNDDEIYISNNRVYPFNIQCNSCRCQQYFQRKTNSNQCHCGHLLKQHRFYAK